MSQSFSQLTKEAWQLISSSRNILLHLHVYPDGDSVGSTLGLYHTLKAIGKNPVIIKGDSDLPSKMSVLPGFNEIAPFNFFETDLTNFDLFIILDSSSLDRISLLNPVSFPKHLKTIVIDHHPNNTIESTISLTDTSYSSTGEMVYDLLNTNKISISPESAVNLYYAIHSDTDGFRHANTTPRALKAAADLSNINPSFNDIVQKINNSKHPKEIEFIRLALENTFYLCNNQVAISVLSHKTLTKHDISPQHSKKVFVADLLRSSPQYKISICLAEFDYKKCGTVFRSNDRERYDVSLLAREFGGGGHPVAAAATIERTSTTAVKKIIESVNKLYPSLSKNE